MIYIYCFKFHYLISTQQFFEIMRHKNHLIIRVKVLHFSEMKRMKKYLKKVTLQDLDLNQDRPFWGSYFFYLQFTFLRNLCLRLLKVSQQRLSSKTSKSTDYSILLFLMSQENTTLFTEMGSILKDTHLLFSIMILEITW